MSSGNGNPPSDDVGEATDADDPRQGTGQDQEFELPAGCLVAARAADARLGSDTVVLSVGAALGITDAFVISSGTSKRQVKAIVDDVEKHLKVEMGLSPIRTEGLKDLQWVLMDYGDFLVHVFVEEARTFYDLEHLWGAGAKVDWVPAADGRLRGPGDHDGGETGLKSALSVTA